MEDPTHPGGTHESKPDFVSPEDLQSTREAAARFDESTRASLEVPRTGNATQTWDWPTLNKVADEGPATRTAHDSGDDTLPSRPAFRLDGYEVIEKIGHGGMGIVYKARRLVLDNLVALKVLPPAFASDGERLERFINEGRIAAGLNDTRILPVLDIKWVDGVPILVMPYVEGGDLRKIIDGYRKQLKAAGEGKPVPDNSTDLDHRSYYERILPVLDQLVEAVSSLHDAGVLHRDIKPSNCLVDKKGNLRLSDFGLARLKSGHRMTTHATGMGTHGYMSPEAWDGREDLDERADIFSLGVTIYQALTFELPYGRDRLTSDSKLPRKGPLASISEVSDLRELIWGAIEPDRDTRYQTGPFLRDWRRVRGGLLAEEGHRPSLVKRGARWFRRRRQIVAIGALVFLMLAVAICWNLLFPPGPADPFAPQTISMPTGEAWERCAFVPLNPNTGEPLPRSPDVVRAHGKGRSASIDLRVKPGLYLIVITWKNRLHHEVYRRVPSAQDRPDMGYSSTRFSRVGGVVQLAPVRPPPPGVERAMTRFDARPGMMLWADPNDDQPPRTVKVASFLLDMHECSISDHFEAQRAAGITPALPNMMLDRGIDPVSQPDMPIQNVEFEEALYYAELAGKRLPTYPEYIAAVSGNYKPAGYVRGGWPIVSTIDPSLDRTPTRPPVIALRSNLGEWTSTWAISLFTLPPTMEVDDRLRQLRLVFGAPDAIVTNSVEDLSSQPDLRARVVLPTREHWLNNVKDPYFKLGFRGARSVSPPYLDPPAATR